MLSSAAVSPVFRALTTGAGLLETVPTSSWLTTILSVYVFHTLLLRFFLVDLLLINRTVLRSTITRPTMLTPSLIFFLSLILTAHPPSSPVTPASLTLMQVHPMAVLVLALVLVVPMVGYVSTGGLLLPEWSDSGTTLEVPP